MLTHQIRTEFLKFFHTNNHQILSSHSLIPENDPSLMFTNAGMVQFKNYFTGLATPQYGKVATSQKCMRASGKHNDLENVGYTTRHNTFFEMLGNFTFGDYFKQEAIEMAWRFLTQSIGLPKDRLYMTVYHEDDESYAIWKKITGFSNDRIIKIPTNDNFWSMGETGPCGPCTEIFFNHGADERLTFREAVFSENDQYIEIWNLVFMQYDQLADGTRRKLPKPCVDTGMGLERIAAVAQGTNDNFKTDIFLELIKASKHLSNNHADSPSHRVIADHMRAVCFLIADGVTPANEGRGYVLRRITRRAIRHAHKLGCKEPLLHQLVPTVIATMEEAYPELQRARELMIATLENEERKFNLTIDNGIGLLQTKILGLRKGESVSGDIAFKLYDTYGFPLDLTKDILREHNILLEEEQFWTSMNEQKRLARAAWIGSTDKIEDSLWFSVYDKFGTTEFVGYTASKVEALVSAIVVNGESVNEADKGVDAIIILNQTPFYPESGGQVGDVGFISGHKVNTTKLYVRKIYGHHIITCGSIKVGDEVSAEIDVTNRNKIAANHSATHLLHYALRKILGKHVNQKGCLVSEGKLRLDFTHDAPLSHEEIREVEECVNEIVIENHSNITKIMPQKEALDLGAMALFGEKYGDEVRVVSIGDSVELCGGTHVPYSGNIGLFKVVNEESVAVGTRRIEAITGLEALKISQIKYDRLKSISILMRCAESEICDKIHNMLEEKKRFEKETVNLRVHTFISSFKQVPLINNVKVVLQEADVINQQDLRQVTGVLENKFQNCVIVLVSRAPDGDFLLLVRSITKNVNAGYVAKEISMRFGGKGGGNAQIAQAGGIKADSSQDILSFAKEILSRKAP